MVDCVLQAASQASIMIATGFGGIAMESAWIAKVLFAVFLVMAVLSFFVGRRPLV